MTFLNDDGIECVEMGCCGTVVTLVTLEEAGCCPICRD